DDPRLAVDTDASGVGQFGQLASDQSRAELDAEARRVQLRLLDLAMIDRPLGGRHAQLDRAGHQLEALALLLCDERLGIEVGNVAGEADRQCAGVKGLDGPNAAAAFAQRLPEGGRVRADRGDDANAGDYRPAGRSSHGKAAAPTTRCRGDACRPSWLSAGATLEGASGAIPSHGCPAVRLVVGHARLFSREPSA